ncbi:MAG: efflux RND transporter periplasmic adaptor subunit [Pseudomonadota bacterium]
MDQLTFRADPKSGHDLPVHKSGLRRFISAMLLACVLAVVLGAGFRLGRTQIQLPGWLPEPVAALFGGQPKVAASGPVVYYRDPDGKPVYSAQPKKTSDGRDFVAVQASEDVSFDDKPAETAADQGGAAAGKKLLYYRNPMGLPDTSPVPKKDSMGMDYIAVYEGEDDGSTVKVSPGRLQRTGVRSEPATRRAITRSVRTPGTVKLDERKIAVISLRAPAFIEKVENVTTGDHVVKDQPLMRLYSPEMALASADLVATVDGRGLTQPNIDGVRRRLQNLEVPGAVIAEIERTRRAPLVITWPAPRDGLVLERNVVDGMRAMPGDVLFRLADTSTIWVLADVSEHDLGLVKRGQQVAIKVRSLPGRSFTGTVALIYPQVNMENRTARVRIEIPNPDGLLLPDMFADVEFTTGSDVPVIAVPDGAVIDTGTRQVVIVDKGDGRFEPRPVKVGVRGDGYTEIMDGISEGDRIVVSANFLIDAESNLKAALRAFTEGEQPK